MLSALASPVKGSTLPPASIHRLGRGLKGYLILVAPHAFVPQRQGRPSQLPSLLVFHTISTDFTPTPCVPLASDALYLASFSHNSKVKPWKFNRKLDEASTDSLRPINPDNAWGTRITAAAGTSLAAPYSTGTVTRRFIPVKSGLQPEGLLPARGVARSGFRPLPKILDCCLP